MASPATSTFSPNRKVTNGWTAVPNSFIENQAAMIPAERALALAIFRRTSKVLPNGRLSFDNAPISDRTWESWTGLAPRQREYAIKGLRERGLLLDGRGDSAKFSWDLSCWNESLKRIQVLESPNPKPKERAVQPGAKIHEECHTNGCAMLRQCQGAQDGPKSISPMLVMPVAQCTAQIEKQPAPKHSQNDTEKNWPKTLTVMRNQSLTLGVSLLIRLLAIIQAMFGKVADDVLSHAVAVAFKDRGDAILSKHALLLRIVPEVLAGMKQRGVKLAIKIEQSPPGELKPSDQEIAQARDILRVEDSGRWKEPDIEWAREVLSRLLLSERGHSDTHPKKKRARDLI